MTHRSVAPVALGLALLGCHRGHDHSHDDGDDHHHEDKTAQITVWSDRYEIFAEHRLVAAGVATKFVTHVTDLQTLEPRHEGPIKFRLANGQDAPVEKVEPEPTRAGIYEAMLTFPKQGDWNVTVLIPTDSGEATVALPKVKVYASKHDAQHGEAPEAPEGISFLKEQQWKILSKAEPVTKRRLVERLRVPATVIPKPGLLARVTPPLPGQLDIPPEGKSPLLGERVKSGQVLAILRPSFSEATAELGRTESEIARARLTVAQTQRDYERARQLFEAKVETQQNVELAKTALDSAQAALAAALALRTSYQQGQGTNGALPVIDLKSPIDGILIAQSSVAIGEHVPADQSIFTILDASAVLVEARVPEFSVGRLNEAKGATAEFPGQRAAFVSLTDEGRGRLLFLGPQVDTASRTVSLVYEVDNRDGRFRVGQQLMLHVETERAEDTVAIPDAAIVEEGGQPIAFVQVSGETFEKRELTLGIRDGNFLQVLRGLNEGERVVTKGAMAIRLAAASNVIPAHGHAH